MFVRALSLSDMPGKCPLSTPYHICVYLCVSDCDTFCTASGLFVCYF